MHPNKFLYDKIRKINKSCKSIGKTKVFFVERKIYNPNIYHVYLQFKSKDKLLLTEIGKNGNIFQVDKEEINAYRLPNIDKSFCEIEYFENIHNKTNYIFGINDCRHFCDRMLDSLYDNCML